MNNLKHLTKIILEFKKDHIVAFIFLILQSICSLSLPFLLVNIVDIGIGGSNYKYLLSMCIIYVIISILQNVFKAITDYRYSTIGGKVVYNLRKKLLNKISNMSGSFYSNMKSGEIYSTITEDVSTIEELCTDAIFMSLADIFMAVPLIIYLFILDYRLFIISIALQPIYAVLQNHITKLVGIHSTEIRDSFGNYSTALQEYLYSPMNHEKNKSVNYLLSKIMNYVKINVQASISIKYDFSRGQICGSFMQSISSILVILIGGFLIIENKTTMGVLLVFLQYSSKMIAPVIGIGQLYMKYRNASVSLKRIFNILNSKSEVNYQQGHCTEGIETGDIKFSNVDFSYNPNNNILSKLNLHFRTGYKTALVGSSGSGKTTVANLIYRLWDTQCGLITIDGLNIKEFNIEYLRDNISIVSQDITLLNDTIINNIVLGDQNISMDEVIKATKIANIYDTIMELEKGFDTIIGDRGIKLSGGQKQRLAISIAILKKRPIVIFDEATSALDNSNEFIIHNKIVEFFKKQTVIIIAHRLSTIKKADLIYVMELGKVVEQGDHEDLIQRRGVYYNLYHKGVNEKNQNV